MGKPGMKKDKSKIEALERQGWTKRFVAAEPRLSEAVEGYIQAGFEVHLEALPEEPECKSCAGMEEQDECGICFEGVEDQYKIIFTRPKEGQTESGDDLFCRGQ